MMWWIIGLVLFALIMAVGFMWWRGRREVPITSIVMLRAEPRELSEADVRGAFRRATGGEARIARFPMGDGHAVGLVIIADDIPMLYVLNASRPYVEDPQAESEALEDPSARAAMAGHRAWTSIDIPHRLKAKDIPVAAVLMMARITAELIDEGCTLLYSPVRGRVALPGPETERILRSDSPMALFDDDEVNAPIIHTDGNDAAMKRAVAKAKAQWPTFLKIWNERGEASMAMVKAGFATSNGTVEFIWMTVSAIEQDGRVTGRIENRPANVPGLQKGQMARVPVVDIVDWACKDSNDQPLGMFVERVIQGS